MKISVVATGGTIGSRDDGKQIDVRNDNKLEVVDQYIKEHGCGPFEFKVSSSVNILSENITENDFRAVYNALKDIDYSEQTGVIVTCGSDTLSYICAFIGVLFKGRNIAVVATNRLLSLEGSNGYANFSKAVDLLRDNYGDVFVPWQNSDGIMRIYKPAQILPCDCRNDLREFPCGDVQLPDAEIGDFSRVLMIEPYPLMDYDAYDLEKIDKVLHLTYHSGTADSGPLCSFIQRCRDKGIDVFIAGIKEDQKLYASAKKILSFGAKRLPYAFPCAYILLLLNAI